MENAIESKDSSFLSQDSLHSLKDEHKNSQEYTKSHPKKCDTVTKEKHLTGFLKQSFRTLSVPKKLQSEKDKNEPSRFLGEGVTFKAKLIGILEVEEARGDRMCQEALFELKMAVRAAGEHKQRINIVIAIDGIRLRDEKTGDCLHHHPVHKISFIAQDVADSRAFGYIFGSPDTSHRFFGIKTDKAASQVVMAMRDLFQAVYELKKREVEMAKQNIEQHQLKYGSSFFLDSISASSSKSGGGGGGGGGSSSVEAVVRAKPTSVAREDTNKSAKNKTQTAGVIADLMDLELELNNLQQGLSQMERLTPCDPFGPSPSLAKEDPFGDSFTPPPCITTPPPTKLPPPPTTGDRRKVGSTSSTASQPELHWFDKETQDLFASEKNLAGTAHDVAFDKDKKGECGTTSRPEVTPKDLYDIFTELDPLGTGRSKPYTDKKDFFQELKNPPKRQLRDLKGGESVTDGSNLSTCFAGTSKSLFSEDSHSEKLYDERFRKYRSVDSAPASAPPTDHRITLAEELAKCDAYYDSSSASVTDPFETSFANFAAFGSHNGGGGGSSTYEESQPRRSPLSQLHQHHRRSPASHTDHSQHHNSLQNIIGSGSGGKLSSSSSSSKSMYKPALSALADDLPSVSSQTTESFLQRNTPPHWTRPADDRSKQKIVINLRKVLSNGDDTDKENDSPVLEEATILRNPDATSPGRGGNASSDSFESIPEPPPRPITSPTASQPPPLPPKKLQLPITMKPPPPQRPASSDALSHYDYIENYQSLGGGNSRHQHKQQRLNGDVQIPPLPAPARKPKFAHEHERDTTVARHRPHKQVAGGASATGRPSRANESDYYLTPIARAKDERGRVRPSLNITISQLTSTGFEDLATMLRIPASALSKMTLKELTECLSRLSDAECQKLEQDMNHKNHHQYEDARYKYRSLNESFDGGEDESPVAAGFKANFEERFPPKAAAIAAAQIDKYAVFRELIEQEELNSSTQPHNADDADDVNAEPEPDQCAKDTADESPKSCGPIDGIAVSGEPTKELTASEQEEQDRYAALRSISASKAKAEAEESGNVSQESRDADEAAREHDAFDGDEEDAIAVGGGSAAEDTETVENGDDAVAAATVESQTDGGGGIIKRADVVETHAATELGRDWAKFDSELDGRDEEPRLATSPWRDERNKDLDFGGSRDGNTEPTTAVRYRKKGPRRKGWSQVGYDEDEEEEEDDDEDEGMVEDDDELDEDEDYGDDSEEEKEDWESSKRSVASSWDESSWRENGWSDRDSLYDDAEASPAPAVSQAAYRLQPPYPKKGYHRRYGGCGPPKKPVTTEHSPWEEEAPGWPAPTRKPAYKEYGAVKLESERTYDERKTRTPPWSGGGGSERKRYETKGDDEDEGDELMLLKMMLGKKRLKALEEQLFKHYHERLSEAPLPSYYNHRAAAATAATMAAAKIAAKEKGGRATVTHGKKYYTAQRPKSADKGRGKPLSLRPPEDTEELFVTNEKKYRRPYSQDELSISEEERWSHKSPLAFKRSSAPRSRHHSQTSPFEDNFAPHAYEFADTPPPLETANVSSTTAVAVSSKGKNAPPPSLSSSSSSRYKKTTATESKKLQQQPVELHPYSAYDFKSGRSSRESSQRQSPFEDDFTPPETSQQPQHYVSDTGTADSTVGPRGSRSTMTARANRANRYEHTRRTAGSAGAEKPSKYYENVELWKKTPSAAAAAAATTTTSGSASESYFEKTTAAGKDKYKHAAAAMKESNGDEGTGDTRSPRKTSKHLADCRRHDPFNDNATGYESRTMPRLQRAKSKSKIQMYDSGSDSPETGRGAAAGGGTAAVAGAVKWKEDLSSFAFGEQQQHSRK